MITPTCHPDRIHLARGLCRTCYPLHWAANTLPPLQRMPARVPDCHPDKKHMARGLCATCYKKQGVKAKGWSRGNLKAQAERFKAKFPDYGSQWMAQRLKRRSFIQQMKSGPCADCGQVFPPEVMDFDHVGPKRFNISSGVRAKGIVALREELAQCQVVCAVCHRIRTARRRLERTVAVPV